MNGIVSKYDINLRTVLLILRAGNLLFAVSEGRAIRRAPFLIYIINSASLRDTSSERYKIEFYSRREYVSGGGKQQRDYSRRIKGAEVKGE